MKNKILNILVASFLVFLSSNKGFAQMRPLSVSEGDYEKCINFCKELDNSEERLVCMKGCSGVSITNMNSEILVKQVSNLSAEVTKKPLNDGQNLFFTDKKTGNQFFAISILGGISGYQVKDKAGNLIPTTVVTAQKGAAKKCYIILQDGTWIEVTCPDIIIIVHDVKAFR
jgi:hypothetical protein